MCGIVGYVGKRKAQSIIFQCLSRLEYRGYDSSGIALRGSPIQILKDKARVGTLQSNAPRINSNLGIGHTRWATHGEPSIANAHPHNDCSGKFAVVHNGIINNYLELKSQLTSEGHHFASDTDTEVIPHLVEKYYEGDIVCAVEKATLDLEGSYAFAVISEYENNMVVAKKDNPLLIGVGNRENLVASDVPAIVKYTNRFICMENGDIGLLTGDEVKIKNNGRYINRPIQEIKWTEQDVGKCDYEHFMLKEINEEPAVVSKCLSMALRPDAEKLFTDKNDNTLILACGTSYHAGLLGKYILEDLLNVKVCVELASEFNCREYYPSIERAILITQSGETADVLLAMKRLMDMGIETVVISNVAHSTAYRCADHAICTSAGPEISVAATKSFIAQLMIFYKLALATPWLGPQKRLYIAEKMVELPEKLQQVLRNENQIMECARYLSDFNNAFYIGRYLNRAVALEGALKLKEISYIHAEACAAGELKHGPLALMAKDMPVIAILTGDAGYDAMMTNIKEAKTRGSPIILVTDQDADFEGQIDRLIRIGKTHPILSPVISTVALQLLAYHTARARNCPIDFPRNLAKSVTVE